MRALKAISNPRMLTRRTSRATSFARSIATLLVAAALTSIASGALADALRIGKAVVNFGYLPLDVGMAAGLYQSEGLEIASTDFTGGAKLHQALTAGSIDIALGGGTDMAFIIKGAPERAIASVTSSPDFLGITADPGTGIRAIDGLKGKKIGVTTAGSLTFWLVEDLNRVRGWGDAGAEPVVIGGGIGPETAALKTKQVHAFIANSGAGYALEEQGIGKLIALASAYVGDLELFTIFASNAAMAQNPDSIRRFLSAWYRSVAYMKEHRDETIAIASKVEGFSPAVEAREYDLLMPQFSTDGRFRPAALERLRTVFGDLTTTDAPIDFTALTTERFLEKR